MTQSVYFSKMKNAKWSDKIISKICPQFEHRWIVWDTSIQKLANKSKSWLEIGSGKNPDSKKLGGYFGFVVQSDIDCHKKEFDFVQADSHKLPFKDNSFDLISLRFVVEHIKDIETAFSEFTRILKPCGHLLILTSNNLNPITALSRLIPYNLRKALISKLFHVSEDDCFPVYGKLNTPKAFKSKRQKFNQISIQYISDLNYARKSLFYIFLIQHLATKPSLLNSFRSNLMGIWQKEQI